MGDNEVKKEEFVPVDTVHIDDAMLVEQSHKGDMAATERLMVKYQKRIFNVILKICANVDDAAELTQETFVKVIENLNSFEARSSFYTWAFRIAVNLALNFYKRQLKIRFETIDAAKNGDYTQARSRLKDILRDEKEPDPAAVAENKELCELVTQSIMKLDADQRAVVVLRDIEGMSYDQIAKTLEIELGTVKSRLSRGRGNLAEIMEAITQ